MKFKHCIKVLLLITFLCWIVHMTLHSHNTLPKKKKPIEFSDDASCIMVMHFVRKSTRFSE